MNCYLEVGFFLYFGVFCFGGGVSFFPVIVCLLSFCLRYLTILKAIQRLVKSWVEAAVPFGNFNYSHVRHGYAPST